jgi:hypothetical protein
MKKVKIVAFITMLVFTLCLGSAYAGTLTYVGTPPGNLAIATEIFGTGSAATKIPTLNTFAAGLVTNYVLGTAPAGDFLLRFTLSNGATFGTAVVPTDLFYGDGTGTHTPGAGSSIIIVDSGGAVTDSVVTFRVTVGVTPPLAGEGFEFNFHVKNASVLATALTSITLTARPYDNLGLVDTQETVAVLTSANGTTEAIAATAVPGTGGFKINVATSNKNFIDATVADPAFISTTQVTLGTVSVTDLAAFEDDATTAWAIGAGNATATGVLSMVGQFAASIAATTVTCVNGGLYLDMNANNVCDAGDIVATTVSATAASFSLTNANLLALQGIGAINLNMIVDGSTAIVNHTPSAALTITWANATYLPDVVAATALRKLEKNGTTRFLYNIPSPDNVGAQSFVRIINDSSVNGKILGTLTLNDGTQFTGTLVTLLAAGNTVVLDQTQIAGLLGVANWTNERARIEINGEIPSMQVQGTLRQTIGGVTVNTNFSTVAPD